MKMRLHSFVSSKCRVENSRLGGKGIFAAKEIKKNELISLWGGMVYSAKEIDKLSKNYPHFSTHTVSIYKDFYLGPVTMNGLDDAEIFNHSCDPNIGIKGQIVLVARRKIQKGEELCFDYDTTETSSEGWFICKCNTKSCRKKIDGSSWKDKKFIKKNWEFLSWYIQEKIRRI